MNKKILSIALIISVIFMAGCGTKKTAQAVSNDAAKEQQTTSEPQDSTTPDNSAAQNNLAPQNNQPSNNTAVAKKNDSAGTSKETMYKIGTAVYKKGDVTINYPEISGLGDKSRQDKINKILKDRALYVLNGYSESQGKLTLEIKYTVTLSEKNLLSVKFAGVSSVAGSAHPNNEFYTANIDINNAKLLKLSDFVLINKSLVKAFRSGTYVPWEQDLDDKTKNELKSEVGRFVGGESDNELISWFNGSDNIDTHILTSTTFCYLTKDSIGISINVAHAIGDHAEYEIKYSDIKNNINVGNNLLKSLTAK